MKIKRASKLAAQLLFCCTLPVLLVIGAHAASRPLTAVPIAQVIIEDAFWSPKMKVWREVTIPDCFAKFEKDGALTNFDKIRDGTSGKHGGPPWYDGLIYEMIRGSADFLAARRDPVLEARLDGYIERIAAAAATDPDGYLNTYTQLTQPTHRWGMHGGDDNHQHDVYNAGAMVEAAVHYYRATGKTRLLQTATRLANYMEATMGPPPKKNVVPGHSLAEEAFVKLYLLYRAEPALKKAMPFPVNERDFLTLAEFWIENRGNHQGRSDFGAYGQDHKPVLQQETIEGHAVRATLLCAGLSAAAAVNGREDYITAARRLWDNMVQRRMYVTGGLGAIAGHEGFGPDYLLPNNGYLETCAAIGAGFWHQNMNLLLRDARYADELERAFYNSILPGVSLKGDTYFYENPLQAGLRRARWSWHGCPCCPPMFLKIMGALPGYIYAQDEDSVYVNQYIGSRANIQLKNAKLTLRQTTSYPWDGEIKFQIELDHPADFNLCLRLPGWATPSNITIMPPMAGEISQGYLRLRAPLQCQLSIPMPVQRIKAHPNVEADLGRVALQRGPLIYCVEGLDISSPVRSLVLPPASTLSAVPRPDLLGGVTVLQGRALAAQHINWPEALYTSARNIPETANIDFTAIPYFANANRQPCEMMVWIADTLAKAEVPPRLTPASPAKASASHCHATDTLEALNDGIEPKSSADESIPRFTWWDHRGTAEWVCYDFAKPIRLSAAEVYWWDERAINRQCRVPQTWRLLYKSGQDWKPVAGVTSYGVELNCFNRVKFEAVETTALKIEVQLQSGWSGGILEWRLE